MQARHTTALILVLICAIAAFLTGYQLGYRSDGSDSNGTVVSGVRIDTVWQTMQAPPLYIAGKARTRVVYDTIWASDSVWVRDTMYSTPAFIAELDTVVGKDTAFIAYRYPRGEFELSLRRAPDSVRVEFKTVTVKERARAWWEDGAMIIGSLAVGMVVGGSLR